MRVILLPASISSYDCTSSDLGFYCMQLFLSIGPGVGAWQPPVNCNYCIIVVYLIIATLILKLGDMITNGSTLSIPVSLSNFTVAYD